MNIPYFRREQMTDSDLERLRKRGSGNAFHPNNFADVAKIFAEVESRGDDAIVDYSRRFDFAEYQSGMIKAGPADFEAARGEITPAVAKAIRTSIKNHTVYNEAMKGPKLVLLEIAPGIEGGRVVSGLESVCLYVPSGKGTYPSSFITIAVPAVVAGVERISVLVPPNSHGKVDPAILFAADILGIRDVFMANGLAGIAGFAIGTKTIPKVDKIIGPGGPSVVACQVYAQLYGVQTALYFGPSECLILADETADPLLVAADLVNEAEHGRESSAILVTTSEQLAKKVEHHIPVLISGLPEQRKAFATAAIEQNGGVILVKTLGDGVDLVNLLCNEHIQVVTADSWDTARKIRNASEILVGQNTTFSAISYSIGVPACLPTGQAARRNSGVTVEAFLKYSAITALTGDGLRSLAPDIIALAEYEGFTAHANSIKIRGLQ